MFHRGSGSAISEGDGEKEYAARNQGAAGIVTCLQM
jgi:hypothetical protein